MKAPTYEPHAGPITLDTLDDLFASRRAIFAGLTMKADDEEEVDDPADEDGEDGTDEDGEDGDDDEYEPPTKEEWEKTQAALKKANAEAKKRRLAAKEQKPKPKPKKRDDDDDDDEGDDDRSAEVEERWKGRVVKQAAKAALATAGAEKPERLLRLVDIDSLDVDDDGEVDGLDDEIDRLREDYPELFKRRRGGRVETGDRSDGKGSRKPMTATERQAAAILGKK